MIPKMDEMLRKIYNLETKVKKLEIDYRQLNQRLETQLRLIQNLDARTLGTVKYGTGIGR